jgi:hemin uptake protein HemP
MADDEQTHDEATTDTDGPSGPAPVIDVTEWFDKQREVVLQLEGVCYRLRLTRRNKLILQK